MWFLMMANDVVYSGTLDEGYSTSAVVAAAADADSVMMHLQ